MVYFSLVAAILACTSHIKHPDALSLQYNPGRSAAPDTHASADKAIALHPARLLWLVLLTVMCCKALQEAGLLRLWRKHTYHMQGTAAYNLSEKPYLSASAPRLTQWEGGN